MTMRPMWDHPETRIAVGRLLGIALCVAAFVVIGIGWHGMARVACVDCQMPYLLSAGVTGIALMLLGVGLLVVTEVRAAREAIRQELARSLEADGRGLDHRVNLSGRDANGRGKVTGQEALDVTGA